MAGEELGVVVCSEGICCSVWPPGAAASVFLTPEETCGILEASDERLCFDWNCLNLVSVVGLSNCDSNRTLGLVAETVTSVPPWEEDVLVLSSCFSRAFWCSVVVVGVTGTSVVVVVAGAAPLPSGSAD